MSSAVRSRVERLAAAAVLVAAMSIAAGPPASAAQSGPAPAGGTPDRAEIARAIATVKADPNLATERTIKTLRWKINPSRRTSKMPAWLSWIGGLFAWLGESV